MSKVYRGNMLFSYHAPLLLAGSIKFTTHPSTVRYVSVPSIMSCVSLEISFSSLRNPFLTRGNLQGLVDG
ncbi:6616_t:CDS:1, partial [Diversispora eburnea]